jgi:inorganic pyrophosphatase
MSKTTDFLNKVVEIKIDRPLGSKHPRYGFVYEVNYGYVQNTISADGEELDAYVLGIENPLKEFTGKCIAVIHRTNDDDDKLIIIPNEMKDISDKEIRRLTNFQEQYFKSIIIR